MAVYLSLRKHFTLLRFAPLVLPLVLTACAGAPIQEMSNARQSVMAAQQSGAVTSAPRLMAQAQKYLAKAQAALDAGDYSSARKNAELAREAALKALQTTEKPGSRTPPTS
ncbi:MAG: DUF4398 domain-containing protein [Gammaproteobacteria bacterium]